MAVASQQELVERIWARDATVWTGEDEDRWLGWLDEPKRMQERMGEIGEFAEEARTRFDTFVLLGMGGSSLAPEVLKRTFGSKGFHVLDTTHPAMLRHAEELLDLDRTLFVVSSKSGTTLETLSQFELFWEKTGGGAGQGTFLLKGGTLTTSNSTDIGVGNPGSAGTFVQSGGVHQGGNLRVGLFSPGTYELSAGTLSKNTTTVGDGANATFVHTGGTHSVNTLQLARQFGTGTYDMSGTAILNAGSLAVGGGGAGQGTFLLKGGTLTTSGNTSIGFGGPGSAGTFVQSGGLNQGGGTLIVGLFSNGTYQLSGGVLTKDGTQVGDGPGVTGTFAHTGGIHNTGPLIIARQPTAIGSYNLSGSGIVNASSVAIGADPFNPGLGGAGTFMLSGGTLNVTTNVLVQQGVGHGTLHWSGGEFNAATLTNNGSVNLSGAGTRAFSGDVVSNGSITVTNTDAKFTGAVNVAGRYQSTASNNQFANVVFSPSGHLVADGASRFQVGGNFVNNSLLPAVWDTDAAALAFTSAPGHNFYLAGLDQGAHLAGYTDNFAWAEFLLDAGGTLTTFDGNSLASTAALYTGRFLLGGGLSQLGAIHSDFNMYYLADLAGNEYLAGLTYNFDATSRGHLIPIGTFQAGPVPEPSALLLLVCGLTVLGLAGRGVFRSSR